MYPDQILKLVAVDRETIAMHVPQGLDAEKVKKGSLLGTLSARGSTVSMYGIPFHNLKRLGHFS